MSNKQQKLYFWFICLINVLVSVHGADPNDIMRLRQTLLTNYDIYTRPVQNHHDITEVHVSFELHGFEFDEHRGMITLNLLTLMGWTDEHMSWKPEDYGNLSYITFAIDELWHPDISVINNFDESEIDHFHNVDVLVYSDSYVWWVPPSKFQVYCGTDFTHWPYDRQNCIIHVSSWSHHGSELDITVTENNTDLLSNNWINMNENREWKVLRSSVKRYSEVGYCCPAVPFVYINIQLEIERRSTVHTTAITVVGMGIAIATLLSFWLDPFANERIPITVVVMLINALFLKFMHHAIPNNGSTVPLAICFFRDSLIMVTFAFGWVVMMRYMAKTKRNSPVQLSDFVETLINSFVGTILCLNPRPQSKGQGKSAENIGEDGDVSELVEENNSSNQEDWQWLARLLDRIAFFAYLIAYTIFIAAFL